MKNRTKYLSAAAAVMLCGAAFAGQDDAVITFSTTADFYADGTPVKDGEFYALCWSEDASFGGLTAQGEAVMSDEKVLAKIPLAKDGRCPTTVFEVDSGFVSGGYFFVYLLDTRDAAGKPATSSAALAASGVNGSVAVVSAAAAGNGTIVSQTGVDTSETPYVATDVSNVPNPTVESLTIDGDNAIIAVGNLVPYVKYNVKKGATIGEIETLGGQPLQGKAEGVTFVINKKDANFFKVVRQPVNQPLTATEE